MRKFLFLLLAVIACCAQLYAQVDTGTIGGTVHDPTGAVVVNATVTVKNLATQVERKVQTNDAGQYTIPGLRPGTYEVYAASTGFAGYRV